MSNKIKGIRTDWQGTKKEVELEYTIHPNELPNAREGERIFQLIGGVTGFESFIIRPNGDPLHAMRERGWTANMGGMGYDKLEISPEEMKKVIDVICDYSEDCKNNYTNNCERCERNCENWDIKDYYEAKPIIPEVEG